MTYKINYIQQSYYNNEPSLFSCNHIESCKQELIHRTDTQSISNTTYNLLLYLNSIWVNLPALVDNSFFSFYLLIKFWKKSQNFRPKRKQNFFYWCLNLPRTGYGVRYVGGSIARVLHRFIEEGVVIPTIIILICSLVWCYWMQVYKNENLVKSIMETRNPK